MLSTYQALFRHPGTFAFSSSAFLARVPIAMLGIGTVLMVSASTGTYGLAGAVAGTTALAGAIVMPQVARLVDSYGQARILRPVLAVFSVAVVLLVLAVRLGWPHWSWFAAAALAGGMLPSVGSMVRARWAYALTDARQRDTAFALESALDEVIFVIGPPLATVLATTIVPEAGLLALLVFAIGGGLLFASRRETEPPPTPPGHVAPRRDVFSVGMSLVCAAFVAAGVVFGGMEVTVVAFTDERGVKSIAGLVLAAYAAGSLVAGLWYGARHWNWPLPRRFTMATVLFGVVSVLPALAPSVQTLAPMIFLTGLAIAPVLIGGLTLVERLVPRTALTEGLTWSTTSLTLGVTVGAAVAGPLIDAYGAHVAFRLPAVAALLAALVGLAGARAIARAHDVAVARLALQPPLDVPAIAPYDPPAPMF